MISGNKHSALFMSSLTDLFLIYLLLDFVPNTSDEEGRYSYKNQPHVGFFNLEKLLEALRPLLEDYSE